jgi:hypothetical protein
VSGFRLIADKREHSRAMFGNLPRPLVNSLVAWSPTSAHLIEQVRLISATWRAADHGTIIKGLFKKTSMNNFFRTIIAGYGAKKLGGGCFGTILVFIIIYYALGQCN